jgi:hypothetical protein
MTRSDQVAPETGGVFSKYPELDFPVTQHIRVRRSTGLVRLEEVAEHALAIFPREVDVMQRNLELFADPASVLQIAGGGTVACIVFPVRHVQGMHVRALLLEQQGGNGGVDAAGQAEDDTASLKVVSRGLHGTGNCTTGRPRATPVRPAQRSRVRRGRCAAAASASGACRMAT